MSRRGDPRGRRCCSRTRAAAVLSVVLHTAHVDAANDVAVATTVRAAAVGTATGRLCCFCGARMKGRFGQGVKVKGRGRFGERLRRSEGAA